MSICRDLGGLLENDEFDLHADHLSYITDLKVYCKKKNPNAETVRTSFQRMVKLYVMRNLAKKLPDSSIRGGILRAT